MGRAKITITVDERALSEIDRLVETGMFSTRSKDARQDRIAKLRRSRLTRECAKLDMREEQAVAEEDYAGESERPEY